MSSRGNVAAGRLDAFARFARTLSIPPRDADGRPVRDDVRAIEAWMAAALADPGFMVECLRRDTLAHEDRATPPPALAPFFAVHELGVQVALAHWAPGREAGAHEHANWTVTAVVHNELAVETYDWERACRERRLVPKRTFAATRGRVGHIYDPCLHNPRNSSAVWSISLHVFGPPKASQLGEGAPVAGLEAPRPRVADGASPLARWRRARARRQRHHSTINALCGIGRRDALELLGDLYAIGDLDTRLEAARAIQEVDPSTGDPLRAEAEQTLPGPSTLLERAHTGLPFHLESRGGTVGLVASQETSVVFLRAEARAARALRFVAETNTFAVGDIQGDVALEDRVALARALVSSGLFQPIPPRRGDPLEGERPGHLA